MERSRRRLWILVPTERQPRRSSTTSDTGPQPEDPITQRQLEHQRQGISLSEVLCLRGRFREEPRSSEKKRGYMHFWGSSHSQPRTRTSTAVLRVSRSHLGHVKDSVYTVVRNWLGGWRYSANCLLAADFPWQRLRSA